MNTGSGGPRGPDQGRLSAECRNVIRRLEEHAARAGASRTGPDGSAHLATCDRCAERVRLARMMGSALRARPAIPRQLTEKSFFEAVLERVVSDMEAAPLGVALGASLRGIPAPAAMPWPIQAPPSGVGPILRNARAGTAPGWLWRNVRGQPTRRIGSLTRARALVLAATVALLAVFGWQLGRSDGTSADVQIVFVPVAEMPSVLHPAAILRRGGLK